MLSKFKRNGIVISLFVVMAFAIACSKPDATSEPMAPENLSAMTPEGSAILPDGMEEAKSEVEPSSAFEPLTPENPSALSDAIEWATWEFEEIDDALSMATEEVDLSLYKSDFQAANSLYHSGEHEAAKAAYEGILAACPVHLGARNNYILALVHLEEFENALKNSILLGLTHPSYEGNWVNILIPLHAYPHFRTLIDAPEFRPGNPLVFSGPA